MSESSPQIGAKLEEYCCKNFPNYFGWKLLGSNLEIKCNRKTSHKTIEIVLSKLTELIFFLDISTQWLNEKKLL